MTSRLPTTLYLLIALCEGFDVGAAGVAAAGLTRELHCTPADLGLFFSSAGVGLLIGSIVGGRLGDRGGRKIVLMVSVVVFGAASLLTSFMPTLGLLTAARFLTGLGLGGALPNLIALAAETSAPGRHNRSIGIAYIGMPIGGALVSLFAFLLPSESWRELFRVGGLAPLLIVPALMGLPREPSVAVAAFHADTNNLRLIRELFGPGRVLQTVSLWLSFFLIVLTLHLMLNWLPFLLTSRGLTRGSAMLAQAGFGIGGALIALGQAALLDSRWRTLSMVASIVVLPLGLVCMALLPAWPAGMIALAMLLGGTILALQVIVYAVAAACYSDEARGTGVGAAVAAGRLGSLAGPLFAAMLLSTGRTAPQVLLGVLPLVLACGACVVVTGNRGSNCLRVARSATSVP